ncbi:MAG TPA: hypothetical protein VGG06_07560 [Thermoanaerobaculia bacterium]|jgi:hypothetical protein
MDRICAFLLLLANLLTGAARAEVAVQYFDEPRVELYRQAHGALGRFSVGQEGVCRDRL